jgi:formate C-acetyltransferase
LTKEIYFKSVAYTPFTGPLNDDCIGRAKDLLKGGMRYYDNLCGGSWIDRAQSDTTDSLMALKKVVFDDKEATMAEVLEALKANFVGYDKLKSKLKAAPKFGNDDDEVDTFHAKWWDYTVQLSKDRLNFMGNRMCPHRQGAGWAQLNGRVVNALPNGRLAGTPLSDAAASPCQGADMKGPTAVLNSVAKLDPDFVEAPLLNMRFTPGPLRTKEGMRKFGDLIKAYFDQGAAHVQFTILDRETLIDAKAHPENYRNLVVRVAGYSAFWVELGPDLQDEIISRSQHEV